MIIEQTFSGNTENKNAFLIPEGTYRARVASVIFIGTVPNRFDGKPTKTVKLGYEIESLTPGGRNRVMYEDYSASLSPNANLRKVIEAVLCRALSKEESFRFDYSNLYGKWCKLVIQVRQGKKDPTKSYNNISAVYPSNEEFAATHTPMKWDVRKDELSVLPEFVQKQVMTSEEWIAKHGTTLQPQFAMGQQVPGTAAQWTPAPAVAPPAATPKPVEATAKFDFE